MMKTELIVIDANTYEQLKGDINFIKEEIRKITGSLQGNRIKDEWLTPAEVRNMLGIGRTKYFQMKSEGAFTFSQFGRKAKISRKSLESFLKDNICR